MCEARDVIQNSDTARSRFGDCPLPTGCRTITENDSPSQSIRLYQHNTVFRTATFVVGPTPAGTSGSDHQPCLSLRQVHVQHQTSWNTRLCHALRRRRRGPRQSGTCRNGPNSGAHRGPGRGHNEASAGLSRDGQALVPRERGRRGRIWFRPGPERTLL